MSDLPISGLLDGSSALGGDQIAIARGGVSYELTLTEVQSFVLGSLPTDVSTNTTNITALQNDRLKLDGSNGPMTGNLDMGANEISTTTNPSTDDMLTRRGWINSNFLNLAGGTMTGAIILHSTGTPSNGAEPISYTFAEATYAKASGANGYIARFTPDGQTLNVSTLRDNGTVASVNDAVDVNSQFSISTSLYKGLRVVQTGTGSTKHGIDIEMTGANNSEGRGIYSRVTSTGTGFAKGMDLLTTSATGNVTGIHNEAWTTGAVSLGKAMQLGLTAGNGSTITSGYQLYLEGVGQSGTGAVTTAYHMYLAAHSAGTTKWAIYQAGANDINYFNGRVGLGTSTISASTQLKIVPANKYGIHVDSDQNTGSTINGIIVDIANTGTGDIEAIYGVSGGTNDAASYTTIFYSQGVTGGTQLNSYHMYLAAHSAGSATWGIHQEGSSDLNRFNGNTGFNVAPGGNKQVKITKDSGETGHSDALFARNDTSTNTSNSAWATGVHGRSVFLSGAPTAGTYAAGRFTFGTELTTNSDTEGAAVIAQVSTYNASNALQNLYGFYLHDFKIDSGHTITGNSYGLYLKGVYGSGAVSGSKYGIYQEGANDDNYFAGGVFIGADTGTTKFRMVDGNEGTTNRYIKNIDTNGNANWATIQASEINGISGTINQIAYFSGTDIISGDSDFLFNGTNVALGDTIDSNRRLKVTNTNALTGIWASSTRVGAPNMGILGTSTGANSGINDNIGIRGYAKNATGTATNVGGQFDYGNSLALPNSSDYAISAYADGVSGRDQYGIYLKSATSNSSNNYGIYLDIGNAGAGEAFGIYETGGGFKNTVVRNVFESLTTVGLDVSAWLTTNTMFAMEGGNNDVSDTLTGYAGGSTGNYTGGYDEYNITRLVKGSSGYSPFAVLSGRGDTNDDEDFGFITITNGDSLSGHNSSGLIAIQMNGTFNHLTDMIFAVRGNGNSNPSTASDTRGHYQEAIRIIGGTSGSYVGNDTDNKIDTSTVTPPTVRFGGSKGYEFPAEDGSANYYLKTDGSGNLFWSAT